MKKKNSHKAIDGLINVPMEKIKELKQEHKKRAKHAKYKSRRK